MGVCGRETGRYVCVVVCGCVGLGVCGCVGGWVVCGCGNCNNNNNNYSEN